MSEIYFTVNPESELYKDYFEWVDDRSKTGKAFAEMRKEFGIETNEFYPAKARFCIVPTRSDRSKFREDLKKTSDGEFKKNTAVHKKWLELTKDINRFRRPRLYNCFSHLGRWREMLFHDGKVIYGCIQAHYDDVAIADTETICQIKASEYYAVREKLEESR